MGTQNLIPISDLQQAVTFTKTDLYPGGQIISRTDFNLGYRGYQSVYKMFKMGLF